MAEPGISMVVWRKDRSIIRDWQQAGIPAEERNGMEMRMNRDGLFNP